MSWGVVRTVSVIRLRGNSFLDIVTDPPVHQRRWQRFVAWINRRTGFTRGDVLVRLPFGSDPSEIERSIRQRLDRQGGGPEQRLRG